MPTSPPRAWADLTGRRVGVWGVGVEGVAILARLNQLGVDPVVVDDAPRGPVAGHEVTAISRGGLGQLMSCEIVVKSPGVSRYRDEVLALEAAGIEVVGGMGLTLEELDRRQVAAITGTKGKSTTTHVVGHLLHQLGRRFNIGGNLGDPPYDPAARAGGEGLVLELSSFHVTDLWHGPRVVALTSLGVDHVDWHGSEERYQGDKLALATLPGVEVVLIPEADEELGGRLRALGVEAVAVRAEAGGLTEALGLAGGHNRANVGLALAVVEALTGSRVDTSQVDELAAGYQALPGRSVQIAEVDGVAFIDDSLATNVLPTLAALEGLKGRRVALLIGGYDRGVDYAPLAEAIAARTDGTLVLTLPESGARIGALVAERSHEVVVEDHQDLAAAVTAAFAWARNGGGVVLLSPAAPSFSQFTNWLHRSEAFAAAVAVATSR